MSTEHPASGEPASIPPTVAPPSSSPVALPSGTGAVDAALPPFPATATQSVSEAPPRRRRRGLLIAGTTALAAGLLAGGFWGWSVGARADYDTTTARLVGAQDDEREAANAFDARMRSVDGELARVQSVATAPEFAADTAAEAEPLRAAIATLDTVTRDTAALREVSAAETDAVADANADAMRDAIAALDGRTDDEGYRPPWELMAATAVATDEERQARETTDALNAATTAAAEAQNELDDSEDAYFAGLGSRGTATIAASPLSTKTTQVDFTRWIEQAADRAASSSRDGAFLASFAAAERAVTDSQARMAAEQNDPALAVRHEIEAYARSISNGITLDFVWAPEVSGLGEGWLSGTAQTWDTDGGWAIISLNYPVEEDWTYDSNARAVVTHEVGHTQVYRENCWPLFSGPVFEQDHEMWATAWAISQGFDVGGSGIEAYGRPSDEQIAVAGQCR